MYWIKVGDRESEGDEQREEESGRQRERERESEREREIKQDIKNRHDKWIGRQEIHIGYIYIYGQMDRK